MKDHRRFKENVAAVRRCSIPQSEGETENKVYLGMECFGVRRKFLLDPGCDMTLVPTSYVRGVRLNPTTKQAFAVNATEVDVKGEVRLTLRIESLELPTTAIVSDDIEEGLLGYDWLEQNDVAWGFRSGRVSIAGQLFSLTQKTTEEVRCCRVVVREDTAVSSSSVVTRPGRVVFKADRVISNSAMLAKNKVRPIVMSKEVRDRPWVTRATTSPRHRSVPPTHIDKLKPCLGRTPIRWVSGKPAERSVEENENLDGRVLLSDIEEDDGERTTAEDSDRDGDAEDSGIVQSPMEKTRRPRRETSGVDLDDLPTNDRVDRDYIEDQAAREQRGRELMRKRGVELGLLDDSGFEQSPCQEEVKRPRREVRRPAHLRDFV